MKIEKDMQEMDDVEERISLFIDTTRAPFPKKLKGQRVVIETRSLYDQMSTKIVVVDRIEGEVVKIDEYGVYIKNARVTRYYNDKPVKQFRPISSNMIVYHNNIHYIYVLPKQ